jgi:translation elongation factor P/translation initiation factor 5A
MVPASQMRAGMAIVFENQTYRVVGAEYHPGQGQMAAPRTRACRISIPEHFESIASAPN